MAQFNVTTHKCGAILDGEDTSPILVAGPQATSIIVTAQDAVVRIRLTKAETAELLGKIIRGRATINQHTPGSPQALASIRDLTTALLDEQARRTEAQQAAEQAPPKTQLDIPTP